MRSLVAAADAALVLVAASLVLSAAGCGGGASSSGGEFTLDGTSLSFKAFYDDIPGPVEQTVTGTITGSKVAAIGVAYQGNTRPGWLRVDAQVTGDRFQLTFRVIDTRLTPGVWAHVLEVGTVDASGKVLEVKTVAIQYTLKERLRFEAGQAIAVSSVFGDPGPRDAAIPVAGTTGKRWKVTTDAGWLGVPAEAQAAGAVTFSARLDASGKAIGLYPGGTITLTNLDDPEDVTSAPLSLEVLAPRFSGPALVVLGGADGRAASTGQLSFSVDTGERLYPWTATLTTASGGAWLSASASSGDVGAAGRSVTLSADRSLVTSGTFAATVRLSANVLGQVIELAVPVVLNVEAEVLIASSNGVGLAQLPSSSVLSRKVKVTHSTGRLGVAWTAEASQPWLSVTGSGTTDGDLTITADPAGLAADEVHTATVAVTSADPRISRGESIRVALWVAGAAPETVRTPYPVTNAFYPVVRTSPAEPWVFVGSAGTDVAVYNVYTGALVKTLTGVTSRVNDLAVSSDGATLFVADALADHVVAVDVATGAVVKTYDLDPDVGAGQTGLAYVRPRGHPLLLTPDTGKVFDVASGAPFATKLPSWATSRGWLDLTATPDGHHVAVWGDDGYDRLVVQRTLDWSALEGGRITLGTGTTLRLTESLAAVAYAPDSSRLYVADRNFAAYDPASGSQVMLFVPPGHYTGVGGTGIAIVPTPSGEFLGGMAWDGVSADLWRVSADGVSLGETRVGPSSSDLLHARSLALSSDGLRLVAYTEKGFNATLSFSNLP